MGCFLALALAFSLAGCAELMPEPLPTPISEAEIPTAIALTLQAVQTLEYTPLPPVTADPSETPPPPTATLSPEPSATPSFTPAGMELSPTPTIPEPSPTATPEIPNAEIEIRNLGPLSRVTSPLHLYTYLRPGAGGKVRFELLGEDNRLLYRNIRVVNFVPVGAWAVLTLDFDFEIAAPAEAGRLQISVDDEFGRTVALNSVPLILLSIGEADIVPPQDVLAPIVIQQPAKKALIQGGKVLVSGLARSGSDQPLMVRLIDEQGSEVGSRLAGVQIPEGSQYGSFAIEVPYNVSAATRVLLVITAGGASLNDVIHLSSREILLSP